MTGASSAASFSKYNARAFHDGACGLARGALRPVGQAVTEREDWLHVIAGDEID
jgi:hypothetical protein